MCIIETMLVLMRGEEGDNPVAPGSAQAGSWGKAQGMVSPRALCPGLQQAVRASVESTLRTCLEGVRGGGGEIV